MLFMLGMMFGHNIFLPASPYQAIQGGPADPFKRFKAGLPTLSNDLRRAYI
jgi:hypothetical protein